MMNFDINKILAEIPNYETFFTMDEMDESTLQLAKDFPDVAAVTKIGESRKGRPMYCIKIGDYKRNALIFASPHPNEPIGSTLLEFFTRKLCEDKAFRDELGYTFYIIKSVDPDGTVLNEGWFKGPFTVSNYAKNFFRPASHEQTEWTFPVEYKTYKFTAQIPENVALKNLIDEIKPEFLFSLHNAGFGGAFWYFTYDIGGCYQELYDLVKSQGLPLNLGEPEAPYATEYAPAIFKGLSLQDNYEYTKRTRGIDPATVMTAGQSSWNYAPDAYGTFCLICEVPYFYNPMSGDLTPTEHLRRDVVLQGCDIGDEIRGRVSEIYETIEKYITPGNNLATAVGAGAKMRKGGSESHRNWAKTNPDYQRPATQAEVFDSIYMRRFYSMLSIGMLARAARHELNKGVTDPEAVAALEKAEKDAAEFLQKQCDIFENEVEYQAMPPKKLITIQMGTMLHILKELEKKNK